MVSLREIHPDDQDRMLDILTSNVVNKTYMLPDFDRREDAIPLFERLMALSKDDGKYVRAIDLDSKLIGFLNQTDTKQHGIELGYVIHPAFHGHGYMTQALDLAMDELFAQGYRQVNTGAFSTNKASIRVMEKCGMILQELTEEIPYRGQIHTCIYYAKTK